jgi:hypothetical protein
LIPANSPLGNDLALKSSAPSQFHLPLALLVLCVLADHPHDTFARDDLAFNANLLDRCPNLHYYSHQLSAFSRQLFSSVSLEKAF